jgi:glutathionyl-hydroquinone reductase
MGMLIDGKWSTEWYKPDEQGRFVRPKTVFRGEVTADGRSGFLAEPGRYHLYASYACPWASRALIVRKLKKLEAAISVSIVSPLMGEDGWEFSGEPGATPDAIFGARLLREIYVRARPDYTGRVTVPVLWDKATQTIVNNESREIIRMLDLELGALGDASATLYPEAKRREIDEAIDAIYEPINNGVYRAGFATSQGAYEQAVRELFFALDRWEGVLGRRRYLVGEALTAADVCLFTTLVRFDSVYHGHFKCNLRRLTEYPNLWGYTRDIYQTPGVAETVDFDHIKRHYYWSHETINPTRIVPLGPELDFMAPHGREGLGGAA